MITREEWDNGIAEGRIGSTLQLVSIIEDLFDQQDQLQLHIKSLEAQLANTEQLTCDGCVSEHNTQSYYCSTCERLPRHDYFKAKGTK